MIPSSPTSLAVFAVLRRSLAILVRHGAVLVPLGLVVMLPSLAASLLQIAGSLPPGIGPVPMAVVRNTLDAFLGLVLSGCMTLTVIGALRHEHTTLAASLRAALLPPWQLFGAAAMVAVLMVLAQRVHMLLLLVPACVFSIAAPAAVSERAGDFRALARAFELTEDSRLRILGVTAIVAVVSAVVSLVVMRLFGPMSWRTMGSTTAWLSAMWAIGSVILTWQAVVWVVVYEDLCRLKDGAPRRRLAGVFD